MLKSWPIQDRINYVELRLQEMESQKLDDPKAPCRLDYQIWLLKEKGNSFQEVADRRYPKYMMPSARKSAVVRAYGRVERYFTNPTLTPDAREALDCILSGVKIVFVENRATP